MVNIVQRDKSWREKQLRQASQLFQGLIVVFVFLSPVKKQQYTFESQGSKILPWFKMKAGWKRWKNVWELAKKIVSVFSFSLSLSAAAWSSPNLHNPSSPPPSSLPLHLMIHTTIIDQTQLELQQTQASTVVFSLLAICPKLVQRGKSFNWISIFDAASVCTAFNCNRTNCIDTVPLILVRFPNCHACQLGWVQFP